MSFMDKAKGLADKHDDKVESVTDSAIEKGGDAADKSTGGKYADKIDGAQDKADDAVGDNNQ